MSHRDSSARWASALFALALVISCGDGGTGPVPVPPPPPPVTPPPPPPPPPPPAPVAGLTANPNSVWVGEVFVLSPTCQYGTSTTASWASASNAITATSVGTARLFYVCANSVGVDTAWVSVMVTPVPPAGRRVTRDRPDEVSSDMVKIVYFTTANGPDRGLDTTGVLENSWGSSQHWLAEKTGVIFRQDTYQSKLDAMHFQSNMTDAEINARAASTGGGAVVAELLRQMNEAGLVKLGKRYLVYYEGTNTLSGWCGAALGKTMATMYLLAAQPGRCFSDEFVGSPTAPPWALEISMLHDAFHLEGAPHVNDIADLMHGGVGGWNATYVDPCGCNYWGNNVPVGKINVRSSPIFIPAPPSGVVRP